VTSPHWAISRPYQPSSAVWQSRVIGSSNPVWIDNDGDGKFTAAREYARKLVRAHGQNTKELIAALNAYDRAVAAQTASLLKAEGVNLGQADVRAFISNAAPPVKEGFLSFIAASEPKR
jgi:hypothetical protein